MAGSVAITSKSGSVSKLFLWGGGGGRGQNPLLRKFSFFVGFPIVLDQNFRDGKSLSGGGGACSCMRKPVRQA